MAASLGLFDGTDFDRKAVRRAGLPEQLLPEVSEEANWAADGCVSLPRSATIRPASSGAGQDGSTRRL